MAIHLEANYSKKLGLPGCSSHQYSVTIKTEVIDPNQVQAESTRLYELLQSCVDREIQKTGFLPQGNDRGNGGTGAFANNNNGLGGQVYAGNLSVTNQFLLSYIPILIPGITAATGYTSDIAYLREIPNP